MKTCGFSSINNYGNYSPSMKGNTTREVAKYADPSYAMKVVKSALASNAKREIPQSAEILSNNSNGVQASQKESLSIIRRLLNLNA